MNEIKIIKIQVDLSNPTTFPKGFVNKSKLDATTEEQILQQERQDDERARLDALNKNA
jgi:putative transcriptional regulator